MAISTDAGIQGEGGVHGERPHPEMIRERLRAAMQGFALHAAVQLVLVWPVVLAAAPVGSESPTEAVRGTITRVVSILEDPALKDAVTLLPRRRMLAEAIAGRFDYTEMSRRAFTVYPVSNMERARAFYEHVLGLYMSHNYRDTWVEYHQSHASLVMTSTATASDTASQMISG